MYKVVDAFPVELVEGIINYLAADGHSNIPSLRACLYVSPTFRSLAEKHLFADVAIDLPQLAHEDGIPTERASASSSQRFLEIIANPESSQIASFVRRLWIRTADWRRSTRSSSPSHVDDMVSAHGLVVSEECGDLEESQIQTDALTIDQILPRLTRLHTLRIGVVTSPLHLNLLPESSRQTLIDICKTQIVSLDLCPDSNFPFDELGNCKVLRNLSLQQPITRPGTTGSEDEEAEGASHAETIPHKVRLDTFCMVDSFDKRYANQDPTNPWYKQPTCPMDLTHLRRLVLRNWKHMHPSSGIFTLCASTLEELTLEREDATQAGLLYGVRQSLLADVWIGMIYIDLEPLQRLTTLKFICQYSLQAMSVTRSGDYRGKCTTNLGWVAVALKYLPRESTVSTVIIDIHLKQFRTTEYLDWSNLGGIPLTSRMFMGLDFSLLTDALIVKPQRGIKNLELRHQNLKRLDISFRVAKSSGEMDIEPPGLPFHMHRDFHRLHSFGVLRTTFGDLEPLPRREYPFDL